MKYDCVFFFFAHERSLLICDEGAEELKAAFGQKEKTRAWKSKIKTAGNGKVYGYLLSHGRPFDLKQLLFDLKQLFVLFSSVSSDVCLAVLPLFQKQSVSIEYENHIF